MEWILHLVAVGAFITMLTSAFCRGSEARIRTIACTAVMVGLAFTPAQWIVHVGMPVLMLSSVEFLFRPLHKCREELITAFGCLAAVIVATIVSGQPPWVLFPLACFIGLWLISGGPQRNRRRQSRELQRRAFHEAAARDASMRINRQELHQLFNHPRLPAQSRQTLHELLRRADALHRELRSHDASARLVFEVEQIHEDFAPTAVRGYLALPPSTADSLPLQDGKTGVQLFDEQLALLDGALDDIAAEARTHGSEGLLASYRFLQDKFGHADDELKL
ncbi:hypothetical protein [Flexivirga sp. B27]